MIFRNGTTIETIRGADPRKLTSAVENAVQLAGIPKPSYSTPGRTLGGTPSRGQSLSRPLDIKGFFDAIIAFFGLYFYSLFSLDPFKAAESSPFNIHKVPSRAQPSGKTGSGRTGAATQVGKKLGTISDFSGGD